ncbi:HEAT repeat-containing protein [Besnoitia besnoiti]|uniref:HEAT repeat-containing protein n=1 Tax=Besnoitia besnoiti TaxID=94643 RepID=A0A2A9M6U8_BESBE|nr:HEAT repeat-containing protein [Besnoitia besnoiti]PFH33679.1 HEAT repeat-containing protein [Besnoitia besnoiti]
MREHLAFLEQELVGSPDTPPALRPSQAQQVAALSRLSWICAAMGAADSRALLLPFLESYQDSRRDADEILSVLAAQWRAVARGVAGACTQQKAGADRKTQRGGAGAGEVDREVFEALGRIVASLEVLAAMEEKCIRDEAVTSMLYLLNFFPEFAAQKAFAQRFLLPAAARLAQNESGLFFSRCSAAKLLPALFPLANAAPEHEREGGAGEEEKEKKEKPGAAEEERKPLEDAARRGDERDKVGGRELDRGELKEIFEKLLVNEALLVRRDAALEVPAFVRHWRRVREQTRRREDSSRSAEEAHASELAPNPEGLGDYFLSLLKKMSSETIDFLRAAAVSALIQLALLFPATSSSAYAASFDALAVLPFLSAAVSDASWRVRAVVARALPRLVGVFRRQLFASHFFPFLQQLLRDSALRDVRQEAIRAVGEVAALLSAEEVQQSLVPLLPALIQENSNAGAVAQPMSAVPVIAPPTLASPLNSNSPLLVPVLEVALPVARAAGPAGAQIIMSSLATLANVREEGHVRMLLAQQAGEFCRLVAAKGGRASPESPEAVRLIEGLCAALGPAAGGGDWTLRVQLIEQVVPISSAFGLDFFTKHLQGLFINALSDHVYGVREAAVDACQPLTAEFGSRWAIDVLLPRLREVYFLGGSGRGDARGGSNGFDFFSSLPSQGRLSSSYLERIAVLHAVPKIAASFTTSETETHLLPFILAALKDEVPNVKFTGAEVVRLMVAAKTMPATAYVSKELFPILSALSNDPDVDVRFCCQLALAVARS